MRTCYVLDTNVILHEPRVIFRFVDSDIVLPIYVIEELDRFKKDMSGLGRNAREFSREIDELRTKGDIREGVPVDGGSTVRVAFVHSNDQKSNVFAHRDDYDNLILRTALEIHQRYQTIAGAPQVIFVTKDANLRIRADVLGLRAEDYDPDSVEISDLYEGHRELDVESDIIEAAYKEGVELADQTFNANEFVLLREQQNPNHTALCRFDSIAQKLKPLPKRPGTVWGITSRNKEQAYALNLLLDDSVQLVTLIGKAGTGKTLLALAAGLSKVTDENVYQKVLVSRPIFPLGRDLGYLPGTIEEKFDPWMKPIHDNVDLLLSLNKNARRDGRGHEAMFDMGFLEIEPLTYIRGRSIPKQYLIIDEAQNLTPHEVKTIITRAGEGTKLVFTGDPYQIDNPYVDSANNGLVHLVNKFQNQPIAGTVTLAKGERSPLAELAANLL